MELPRRAPGDELLPPGEMARLRMRLRDLAPRRDLTTVIACAFDHRTRILPFIGADKASLKIALETMFGNGTKPLWFHITRALHMLFSSAMIFLVLLALRNRFKLK